MVGVLVLLLATAGIGTWLLTRRTDAAAAQTITATIATGTFQDTVSATGALEPTRQADLDFAVSGRVTSVAVAAGDKVEKGDVLARLDRTSLDAALTSAQAQLTAARAQYDDDLDADAASTQLAADSANVAAAESGLSQAQDDLDAATLTATMTGTVASVDLTVGDQVSGTSPSSSTGSASSGGATPGGTEAATSGGSTGTGTSDSTATSTSSAVVIVSPRHFKVEADVSADDVTSVKKGMQAQVTPTGATAAVFGTVTSVGLVAEASSSGAATFPVTVTLTGPQTKVYAGTSATVSIITKQVVDVLSVPTLALHTKGSTTYVVKLVNGSKVNTTVKLGATYGASTAVTSGLKAGDKVVMTTLRLPGAGSNRTGGTGGTGGGFGGGDFPGGGGTGGPPGAPPAGGVGGTP
jgi:multidrug efflux pump subunit AcrA (membrane-fusion protein)